MIAEQSVILCEGFDDRAFLAEWLSILGCTDARVDPWERPVARGEFGFRSPTGRFIRLHPCHGKTKLVTVAERYLDQHGARPVSALALCYDDDTTAPQPTAKGSLLRSLASRRNHELSATASTLDIQGIPVQTVVWGCSLDSSLPGIPAQQCLERLVTAAVVIAYPERGPSVEQWLHDPPQGLGPEHKSRAYAYLAKWYAAAGCEEFYRAVWRDPPVRTQLETLLRESGAYATLEALLVGPPATAA